MLPFPLTLLPSLEIWLEVFTAVWNFLLISFFCNCFLLHFLNIFSSQEMFKKGSLETEALYFPIDQEKGEQRPLLPVSFCPWMKGSS